MDSINNIYGAQSSQEILIRDTVTKETKARYDELLTMISDILVKSPATEADSIALDACFKELQQMQKQGLDPTMNDTLKLLYFYMEGAGANPSQGDFKIDPVKIESLNSDDIKITLEVPDKNGIKTTQELKLAEAIKAMVDPNYNPTVTDTLSKMLLDYSKHGYEFYTSELEGLKQQLDIASTSINNLKALQDILNMVEVPEDYSNYDSLPKNWDQIPPEIQDEFKKMFPDLFLKDPNVFEGTSYWQYIPQSERDAFIKAMTEDINYLDGKTSTGEKYLDAVLNQGKPTLDWEKLPKSWRKRFEPYVLEGNKGANTPSNFSQIENWIKDNPDRYQDMYIDFIKKEPSIIPVPQPNDVDAMNRLIGARDELQAQFDALDALGEGEVDKGEGSAWATLKTVLEDLEKYVPSSTYPPGSTISMENITTTKDVVGTNWWDKGIVTQVTTTTSSLVVKNEDGSMSVIDPTQVNKDICGYISAGHSKDNNINEAIDNAVNANQNLSSEASDNLKAANLEMQTWYDILTQVADGLNKALQAIAQKTGS